MKRLLILGVYGMLGAVVSAEAKRQGWDTFEPMDRDIADRVDMHQLREYNTCDAVINCAGVIPTSHRFSNAVEVIRANSIGPRIVANTFEGRPVIHVSTDCVFDSSHNTTHVAGDRTDASDLYGRSKALGEPDNAIVVRTSFIGPKHGLLRWLLDQPRGSMVEGWVNAIWSGSTVYEVARHLVTLAGMPPAVGPIHLAAEHITKYDLLRTLNGVLGLGLHVEPVYGPYINRCLTPTIKMERRLFDDLNAECQRSDSSRS